MIIFFLACATPDTDSGDADSPVGSFIPDTDHSPDPVLVTLTRDMVVCPDEEVVTYPAPDGLVGVDVMMRNPVEGYTVFSDSLAHVQAGVLYVQCYPDYEITLTTRAWSP